MEHWRPAIQDILDRSWLRFGIYTHHRWLLLVMAVAFAVGIAVGGGWLIAELGPLPVIALLVVLAYAVVVIKNLEAAYFGVIAVIALLPFGALPFSIGFTPTFLDLAVLALFAVWLLPIVFGAQQSLVASPVGGAVLAFLLLALAAFVQGLSHGVLTSYLIRHFAEVLLSILIFFLVVNTVTEPERLGRLVAWLILAASAAACIGIVLYVLPDELTMRILSVLARFGYPTGPGVIRYIRDDPSLMKRATSTSVDPNVLGSLLNLAIAMAVPQLLSRHSVLPRWVVVGALGVMGGGLVLTASRGSMGGVAVAVLAISLLRYRKLLPWIAVVAILFLVLPWTQELIAHFVEGVLRQDLSTQMRMGEYKDALILIGRYPFLGVGFAGTPDLDIYVAVANVYLTVAAQMGLVGLGAFLLVVGMVLARFWRRRKQVANVPALEPLWYGVHAALIGGLVGGMFDHYFFSLSFHHSVSLFWLVVGLATAATQMVDTVQSERSSP